MPTPSEQIKEKIDIVEFIGERLKLQKAGRNYKALCPFHQEKTPSFIVSPERQTWHCFGACSEGGDLFKFLMRYENLEFYEALKVLAEKAGVELRHISPAEQKEFGVLYDLNEAAKEFFKAGLKNCKPALDYLGKRGLKPDTIEEFELGWAPGGESLTLHLINAGNDIKDVARAGLSVKTESGPYRDRFHNRIIFPVYNSFGKTVGFGGRILPSFETENTPKYLNSPETPIFNKSRILYGLHKSKGVIGRTRQAFLVEGYMDFLMVWQSGINNAAATCGTSLGLEHLKSLKRLTDNLIISFDQDEAGLKALERALDITGDFDFNIKVVNLGNFKDPAEAAEKDPEFLKSAIAKCQPALSYLFDHYLRGLKNHAGSDPGVHKSTVRTLLAKIGNINSPLEQSYWVKELSDRMGVEERVLALEMAKLSRKRKEPSGAGAAPEFKNKDSSRRDLISERLLSLAVAREDFMSILAGQKEYFSAGYRDVLEKPDAILTTDLGAYLNLQATYVFADLAETKLKAEFDELLKNLKLEHFRQRNRELSREIKSAEKSGDEERLRVARSEFQSNSLEISNLS